ncbi:MAG: zf-TFIIB domain-containing protein [Noviherbaspirillum sp.]
MDCPVCKSVNLVMSERQGIEIDYCPNCRGVWLDRGELDKIIDRSAGAAPQSAQPMPQQPPRQPPYQGQPQPPYQGQPQQPYQGHGYPQQGHYKKKKREGFLSDLFDFD